MGDERKGEGRAERSKGERDGRNIIVLIPSSNLNLNQIVE